MDSPNKACTPLHILSCDELGSAVCQRSWIFTWYQTQSNHPQRSQTSKVSMNFSRLSPVSTCKFSKLISRHFLEVAWWYSLGLPCLCINYVTIHKNRNKFHLYLIQLWWYMQFFQILVSGDVVYAHIWDMVRTILKSCLSCLEKSLNLVKVLEKYFIF